MTDKFIKSAADACQKWLDSLTQEQKQGLIDYFESEFNINQYPEITTDRTVQTSVDKWYESYKIQQILGRE